MTEAWHDLLYLLCFSKFLLYFEGLHFVITVVLDVSTRYESPSVCATDSSCKSDWDQILMGAVDCRARKRPFPVTTNHDQVSLK